jgi:hypothetical protein
LNRHQLSRRLRYPATRLDARPSQPWLRSNRRRGGRELTPGPRGVGLRGHASYGPAALLGGAVHEAMSTATTRLRPIPLTL